MMMMMVNKQTDRYVTNLAKVTMVILYMAVDFKDVLLNVDITVCLWNAVYWCNIAMNADTWYVKGRSVVTSAKLHCGLCLGERPFECRICKMAFTTNGNMHRHMRIHEKEPSGSTAADPDSPHSLVISPSSRSPRGKKRPLPIASDDISGWSRNLFDDGKGLKRKLQADDSHSPVKKIFDGAVDLRYANKTEVCSDEQSADDLSVSASSSQQVSLLHNFHVND